MILFKIEMAESRLGSVKSFKDVPDNSLLRTFVSFARKKMNYNFLANKIQRWFNENGGKQEKEFTFRFRGKESFLYMKHFPSLIKMLISNIFDTDIQKRLIEVYLQSIYLCQLFTYTVRKKNFDLDDLNLMKKIGKKLFKLCSICDNKILPSLWTLCNVAPIYAEKCFLDYKFGLGCNMMEGRKHKHQMLLKYAENTTRQNRWPMIFRHEYIQLIYLRINGHDSCKYVKRIQSYVPLKANNSCEMCFSDTDGHGTKCVLCKSPLMIKVQKNLESL